ncbi:hypothetical protein DM02DRAFT_386746 [Periconia macrospinosa]|uniref:Uncharacterized protein n=1 Tax=Periconia macrospinosa TaxID=97972 RepID=A0A2V1CZ64_9PLEO|nr:hypothetical protein DM02DRAFT_386746 [Periconia macrospinosa]
MGFWRYTDFRRWADCWRCGLLALRIFGVARKVVTITPRVFSSTVFHECRLSRVPSFTSTVFSRVLSFHEYRLCTSTVFARVPSLHEYCFCTGAVFARVPSLQQYCLWVSTVLARSLSSSSTPVVIIHHRLATL